MDPFALLNTWLENAITTHEEVFKNYKSGADSVHGPKLMCLSTCNKDDSKPSSRMVDLAGCSANGITFFTDPNSRKAKEFSDNPFVSAVLYFPLLERQVRIEGKVQTLPQSDVDEYFRSLPRNVQLTLLMNKQGHKYTAYEDVVKERKAVEEQYKGFSELPVTPNLIGCLLVPSEFQFYQGNPDWLSDCAHYVKQKDGSWYREFVLC